jgi:hypothetical protein
MAKKSYAEIALEIYESVEQSNKRQRHLKSSTFWGAFRVRNRTRGVIERVERILSEQGLRVSVKSGDVFGHENRDSDWIVLTLWPPIDSDVFINVEIPPDDWFQKLQAREFDSEREVEYYFIIPMLEQMGYTYDDTSIGYSIDVFKGVHKTKAEIDIALFNGQNRERENALLIIEGKNSDKGITVDHIGQARAYSQELLPACYVITNGQKIMVYKFNGMLYQDERVMDFDIPALKENWEKLYRYISKDATIKRKEWMREQFSKSPEELPLETSFVSTSPKTS